MTLHKIYYPACTIALLVVLAFGLCNVCQLYQLKDNYPINKLWIGSDYACIYSATKNLARGGSPYENEWTFPPIASQFTHDILYINKKTPWYNYSPIPAYLNYPFVYLDIDTASRMLFFLLIIAVVGAYMIINYTFEYSDNNDRKIIFLCGLVIIVLSYPFYFLIARGHMTGIVIMLLAMGIYFFKKNNSVCSIFFGLSIGMIIYPVLLLVPLLLFRRYKIIAYTVFTIIILVLCCPILWFEFLKKLLIPRIIGGGSFLTVQENCSLTNVFFFLSLFINKILATAGFPRFPVVYDILSQTTNAIMLFTMVIADIQIQKRYSPLDKELETAFIMMYLPFMISIPTDSYQYGLVLLILLIPVISVLTQKLTKQIPKIILWIFITGIFLTQFQAHSFQQLLNPQNSFFHFFPAFGLFLVMIGCVTFKIWFWWRDLNRPETLRILPE